MAVISSAVELKRGIAKGHLNIPGNFLNDGSYFLPAKIVKDKSEAIFNLEESIDFTVEDNREGTAWYGKWVGGVRPTFFDFKLIQDDSD